MPKSRRRARSPDLTDELASVWRAGRGPIGVLPALLFRDRQPWLAIVVAWLIAFAGSSAIGAVIAQAVPEGAGPDLGIGDAPPAVLFVGIALASPVAETLLMGALLNALLRFCTPWLAVLISAAGWGIAHSLLAPWWGAVIWWPFLIFSTLFVTWRGRGFWTACSVAAAVHVLQNSGPVLALLLGY